MKKKFVQISLILLVFCLSFNFHIPQTRADTEIKEMDNCSFSVIVKIAFDFKDLDEQSTQLLGEWHRGMNEIWNGTYGSKYFDQQYPVDYEFDLVSMMPGLSCQDYPDYHCITVVNQALNRRGNIADALIVKANSENNSWGEWTLKTTGLNAAHEVGHMMGLNEEYHYERKGDERNWVNDNYKLTGPQSIMAQTWAKVVAFSEHTEEIFKLADIEILSNSQCKENADRTFNEIKLSVNPKTEISSDLKYYPTPWGQKVYTERINIKELAGSLIKGRTDPAVYFVDQQGQLRWVKTENVARKLFGNDWNKKIIWFGDSIIYTYSFGESIND